MIPVQLNRSSYGNGDNFSNNQYKKFADYEIEIIYQPLTTTKYITNLLELQSHEKASYYPIKEEQIKTFFESTNPKFDYRDVKYTTSSNIETIGKIISYICESGYNYNFLALCTFYLVYIKTIF